MSYSVKQQCTTIRVCWSIG